jgi:hypothetical protein
MGETPGPQYHPRWLTEEGHQTLFGELLAAPQGFKAERLAELLKRVGARAQEAKVKSSLKDNSVTFDRSSRSGVPLTSSRGTSARRTFAVLLLGLGLLTTLACLSPVFARR